MSRTQKREGGTVNPIQKFVTYKPNTGVFDVYDKKTKTKTEMDSVDIIVLDADRHSITGYSPEHETGFLCNLVINTKKEELTVGIIKNGKYEKVVTGFYQDIKDDLEGARYTNNVIVLFVEDDGSLTVADVQLSGMARKTFADWYKDNLVEAEASVITLAPSKDLFNYVKKTNELEVVPKAKQKRWRTTWLRLLELTTVDISDEQDEAAMAQDAAFQDYLKGEAGTVTPVADDSEAEQPVEAPTAPADADADDKEDLPF